MIELLHQIVSHAERGEVVGVCALVRTRGSTPQKAGAMMVVLGGGQSLGTIGGGCVEAEVRSRAMEFMLASAAAPAPASLLRFKLDHDHGWDDGLVCGGVMEVAVQVLRSNAEALEAFAVARDQLAAGLAAKLKILAADEHGAVEEFEMVFEPEPTLIIAGAGHVGAALAAIGHQLNFHVIVIDDRADYASAERLPHALIRLGQVDAELQKIALNAMSYVVIVTRGHRRDALALAAVVRSAAGYVGLIGSKRKVLQIFSDLAEQGVSAEQLKRVHAPIGLGIGAVTPSEIAVSIAAEVIAVRRGIGDRAVTSLRLTEELLARTAAGVEDPGTRVKTEA